MGMGMQQQQQQPQQQGGGMGMGMQQGMGMVQSQVGSNQQIAFLGQRFRGTVKSYSESNGYGFIGGDEVLGALGKDVFVHQREITEVTGISRPQVPSGVVVTFAVTINPKGQPQARELRFEDQSFLQMQQMGQSLGMTNPHGQGGQAAMVYVQNGRRFRGFVRSFSQVNGFGFVGGDDITQSFGKDVFLHFRELQQIMGGGMEKPTIPSGTWVTFTVTMNQKGQPQARDVMFESSTGAPPYDPTSAQGMGATAAVAALNLQNQGQVGMGAFAPQTQTSGYQVSDADAYARVQADIERFQKQVEEQRAQKEKEKEGTNDDDNEGDLKRDRGVRDPHGERHTTTTESLAGNDTREKSRSPRRE